MSGFGPGMTDVAIATLPFVVVAREQSIREGRLTSV